MIAGVRRPDEIYLDRRELLRSLGATVRRREDARRALKGNATDGLAALGGASDQPPQARDRDLDPDEEALVLATLDAFGVPQ